MIQSWKVPHILKGTLTWVPLLNAWRRRRASTGGTDNPRYCYSVWLRHLATLQNCGFQIKGAQVGELGPGDSIGTGLAALLAGANYYIGLDLLPLSARTNLEAIFENLVQLYAKREPIPDDREFPRVRPQLESYRFPDQAIDWPGFNERVKQIRAEIKRDLDHGQSIHYRAPWTSINEVAPQSLDLIFSQAVLEYVIPVEQVYRAMSIWLKPAGHASHVIDLTAHYLSPYWNGHWAYSKGEWGLTRGRRETFLNREPLNTHLACARKFGLEVIAVKKRFNSGGLPLASLAPEFQNIDLEDLQTSGAYFILRRNS